jgi:hypothetical protein
MTRKINQNMRKLAQTPTLKKIVKMTNHHHLLLA